MRQRSSEPFGGFGSCKILVGACDLPGDLKLHQFHKNIRHKMVMATQTWGSKLSLVLLGRVKKGYPGTQIHVNAVNPTFFCSQQHRNSFAILLVAEENRANCETNKNNFDIQTNKI